MGYRKEDIMKKIIGILVICTMALSGCHKKDSVETWTKISNQTYMLGTLVKVTAYSKDESEETFNKSFDIITDIESKVSKNIDTSEVNHINRGEEITLSESTYSIIEKGLYYSEVSNGKFDITIAPLVDLWGIGSEDARVPSDEEIQEAISKIDYKQITLDEKTRTIKLLEPIELDLGAIAKGYVADQVSSYLREHDMGHAIINLGGNILTVGTKPDGSLWKIGIQNPFDARGNKLGIVTIGQKSVVTSGIYERYLEQDDKQYHHILNPFTGYPVENELASVSILSDHSVDGDGLSTVVFAMGLEEGFNFVEGLDKVDAIFVTKDKEVYMTSGANKIFTLTNYDFKVKKYK